MFCLLHLVPDVAAKNRRQEYWRPAANLRAIAREKPLAGFHIALDPGHLGGKYSEMEGRHFVIGEAAAVKEGDLALLVAKRLSKRLNGLGAKVSLVRNSEEARDEGNSQKPAQRGRGLAKKNRRGCRVHANEEGAQKVGSSSWRNSVLSLK